MCVYMYVSLTESVCVLNIGAESNNISRSHKQIIPPLVIGVIDPSITRNFKRRRYGHTTVRGKARTTIVAERKRLQFEIEREIEGMQ